MRQVGRSKNSVWTVSFFAPTSSASRRPMGGFGRSGIGGTSYGICGSRRSLASLPANSSGALTLHYIAESAEPITRLGLFLLQPGIQHLARGLLFQGRRETPARLVARRFIPHLDPRPLPEFLFRDGLAAVHGQLCIRLHALKLVEPAVEPRKGIRLGVIAVDGRAEPAGPSELVHAAARRIAENLEHD